MDTALKYASLVSASCAVFMVLWNVAPAIRSKMTQTTIAGETVSTPWWKRQTTILTILAILSWVPIVVPWIYHEFTSATVPAPQQASFRLKMIDAFTNRRTLTRENVYGDYPWVFHQDQKMYWVILFDKEFKAHFVDVRVNDKLEKSGSYSIIDMWPRGAVISTPEYNADDVVEIDIKSQD
jgi:hypothetical protein